MTGSEALEFLSKNPNKEVFYKNTRIQYLRGQLREDGYYFVGILCTGDPFHAREEEDVFTKEPNLKQR